MALYLGGNNNGFLVSSDGYTLKDANNSSLMALPSMDKRKIVINNVVYRLNLKLPVKERD